MSVIITGAKWTRQMVRQMNTIFLVGPSKRPKTPFVSYRKRFIELAQKEIKECLIFQPEFNPEAGFGDPNADLNEIFSNSQKWELEAMDDSKVVIMALDTDPDNLGLTTRTELGMLVESRKNLIVYAPASSFKMNYQVELCKLKGIPVCDTLEQVIEETKKIILKIPLITAGRFNSTEIKAENCDPVVLREVIWKEEDNNQKGAIWCFVDKNDHLNFRLLTNLNYNFHHYNPETKQFAYYKWNNPTVSDAVPEYATAIGGACAMILNDDESKVLFVYEESYGKKWWKFMSGGVNNSELSIECLLRELVEELNIKLDTVPIKLVGGYNQKAARYNRINDYFFTFVINISEKSEIKVDGIEVLKTKWVDVNKVISGEIVELDGVALNKFNVDSLRKYVVDKKYLPCKLDGNKMTF